MLKFNINQTNVVLCCLKQGLRPQGRQYPFTEYRHAVVHSLKSPALNDIGQDLGSSVFTTLFAHLIPTVLSHFQLLAIHCSLKSLYRCLKLDMTEVELILFAQTDISSIDCFKVTTILLVNQAYNPVNSFNFSFLNIQPRKNQSCTLLL